MKKTGFFSLVIAIITVNIAGLLLHYFHLNNYVIFFGFRFHLSLVLPFFIVFRREQLAYIKKLFSNPHHKRTVLPLLWILLPTAILIGSLFLLKMLRIGDPDYFYEFGLSSIIDYPVYLLWNFPQALMLFIFLCVTTARTDKIFTTAFLSALLVFAYEFIPLELNNIDYLQPVSFLLIALSAGLMVKFFRNIYWFVIVVFSVLWIYFLCFGSGSEEIVNLLFAAQYNSWEGFFVVNKKAFQYLLPAQLFLTFITILISAFFGARKQSPGF